ncbi:S-adenosyl-dependent methyltransferase [Nitrospira moscoviensis]|uniref:Ribosomal RNA small subunit methyltransferase H n=2 Tax=Nitrospira moscoviensis TaxID=42253 RepID=A0A0K2G7Z3_NITMO|nr:S-adenosyl-dependent methyltransferase [Nitrospira moscoviensis]
MVKEVVSWLLHRAPSCVCDGTVGYGGHAEALLAGMADDGKLLGIDRDEEALAVCRERLSRFGERVALIQGSFVDMPLHARQAGISAADGVLLDLGVSSRQLDDPGRGFSFQTEGPLDMRMDRSSGETAADLVNRLSESDLADLIYRYGEERYSRRIARAIVRARAAVPLRTTEALVAVIKSAVPGSYRHGRIHCATRTFQALRIAVNREIEMLEPALRNAVDVLKPGGRLAVISFHSLEDRIVKQTFRTLSHGDDARLTVLTKKPQVPTEEECRLNPRARSAKLRVAERKPSEAAA